MPQVRGHDPVDLGIPKGLWQRGDPDNVPPDYFERANNVVPVGNDWITRNGIGISQDVVAPLNNIKRAYNYPTQTANTQIILVENDSGEGEIYHLVDADTVYGPLLTIAGMTDFAFVPYAGRAYISPFGTFDTGDINIQKGLQNESLYVYMGDGTAARAAAGAGPTNTGLTIANGTGATDAGLHIFATVYEYNTGYLSPPSQFTQFTTSAANGVSFSGIQTTGDTNVVTVHLVATKKITSFNGNLEGYQFFFIPNANVANGVTVLNNVTFFDADLVEDASHLIDNYTDIPAGCGLSLYHDRLVLNTTYDDISICLISEEGEPEAINQLTGLVIVPPDGNPITCTQELRDVLYVGKRSKTVAYTDNGDDPSTWPLTGIDNALGWPVHGLATVLDSGSSSVDYLFAATFAGIMIFNGRFILPELSYPIQDLWLQQNKNLYKNIQVLNDPIRKWILVVLPDGRLLIGDYNNGLDPKNIRWCPLSFYVVVNSILIVNIDTLIICMDNPNFGVTT